MHAVVYMYITIINYMYIQTMPAAEYGRIQQDLNDLQKHFCRPALTAAMQMLLVQPLGSCMCLLSLYFFFHTFFDS